MVQLQTVNSPSGLHHRGLWIQLDHEDLRPRNSSSTSSSNKIYRGWQVSQCLIAYTPPIFWQFLQRTQMRKFVIAAWLRQATPTIIFADPSRTYEYFQFCHVDMYNPVWVPLRFTFIWGDHVLQHLNYYEPFYLDFIKPWTLHTFSVLEMYRAIVHVFIL